MANCIKCDYRKALPGSCHSICMRNFEGIETPEKNQHGVEKGWCNFPVNFDPIWLGDCEGFAEKGEGNKDLIREKNLFANIFGILGRGK